MQGQRIRARACAAAAIAWLAASRASGTEPTPPPEPKSPTQEGSAEKSSSAGEVTWTVLLYLPNRLFDLSDIVRLKARVGTGFAAGARITRHVPVFVGDYGALWVGLPGPRGRAKLPLPIGAESQAGFEAGPMAVGARANSPTYGVGEIGGGGMLWLVGADIGVDVYELADFAAGFALVDFAKDDY